MQPHGVQSFALCNGPVLRVVRRSLGVGQTGLQPTFDGLAKSREKRRCCSSRFRLRCECVQLRKTHRTGLSEDASNFPLVSADIHRNLLGTACMQSASARSSGQSAAFQLGRGAPQLGYPTTVCAC
jgi:hypothetical protein